MKVSIYLVFSLLFILFSAVYCDRTVTCSGHVYNIQTNEAIDSAVVYCPQLDNESHSVLTNANGDYSFNIDIKGKNGELGVSKDTLFGTGYRECKEDDQIGVDF